MRAMATKRAPRNDCQIIEQMKVYQKLKPGVAQGVLNAMKGQAWYLTPPNTDDDIPDTRQDIASALQESLSQKPSQLGDPSSQMYISMSS